MYWKAAERSSIPTAITHEDGRTVSLANAGWCELVGRPESEVRGQPLTTVFAEPRGLEGLLARVFRTSASDLERNVVVAGGGRVFDAIAHPVLGDDGRARAVVVQLLGRGSGARPAVNARETNDEIREANERLLLAGLREQELAHDARRTAAETAALLENMSEGVAVFDRAARVVLANPVGRALLGFPSDKPTFADYRACDLRTLNGERLEFERDLLGCMLEGERFVDEEVVLCSPGQERHLLMSGSGVRDDQGQVVLSILVYRDVTQLRQLEQLREQYVALISHDLRGPLGAARMAAELLSRNPDGLERRQQLAARMITNLDRMEAMLRDLLDAQRIRAGEELALELAPCDLFAIAREVVEELTTLHGHRFSLRGGESASGVWSCDELRRAIWNLAVNAIKYGSDDAPIDITVKNGGERVALAVHNEGPPIPEEAQARLFDPFSRANTAQGGPHGWGLGLTLVRGCVEAHGGTVTVESTAANGTTFTIELPNTAAQPPS